MSFSQHLFLLSLAVASLSGLLVGLTIWVWAMWTTRRKPEAASPTPAQFMLWQAALQHEDAHRLIHNDRLIYRLANEGAAILDHERDERERAA